MQLTTSLRSRTPLTISLLPTNPATLQFFKPSFYGRVKAAFSIYSSHSCYCFLSLAGDREIHPICFAAILNVMTRSTWRRPSLKRTSCVAIQSVRPVHSPQLCAVWQTALPSLSSQSSTSSWMFCSSSAADYKGVTSRELLDGCYEAIKPSRSSSAGRPRSLACLRGSSRLTLGSVPVLRELLLDAGRPTQGLHPRASGWPHPSIDQSIHRSIHLSTP